MARGYSASRSGSKRPTLRLKRERSVSIANLRTSIDAAAAVREEAAEKPAKDVMRGAATPRGLSAKQAKRAESASQKRSASTLRMRLADMEEELGSDAEASEDEQETVQHAEVMAKYKAVGRVVDEVLDIVAAACVRGARTKALCDLGDSELAARIKSLFAKAKDENGKRIQKGICYPTNVSVNEVVCNHSPFRDDESVVLRGMDVVKIHCGCHLDGYPVVAARTIVVPRSADTAKDTKDLEGTKLSKSGGNAVEAARLALTGAIHMLRPGTVNGDITDMIAAVGNAFGAEAIEGVLSNRVKRWVLDGVDCIIARRIVDTAPQQDVAECEIGPHQVWALDVAFTNCLGTDEVDGDDEGADDANGVNGNEEEDAKEAKQPRRGRRGGANADDVRCYRTTPTEEAATLFRRAPVDFQNDARVQHANDVLTEITDKYGCFPFHFKALSHPLKGKMGINVLMKHQVVDRLSPMRVKNSLSGRRITARFSATVAVTGKRTTVLCGAPPSASPVPTSLAPADALAVLPEDIIALLNRPLDFATAAALRAEKAGQPSGKRARKEA